jgi:hypothetical protein
MGACPARLPSQGSVQRHAAAGLATQKVGKEMWEELARILLRCRTYGARISSVYCFYKDIAATLSPIH